MIDPPSPQALALGSEIWELRKKGFSAYEVHLRLAIPLSSVEQILEQFEGQLYPDVGAAMAQRLVIDDGRLEDLFKTYLPLAASGSVKAAGIVLTAIQRRIQLALACRPESAGLSNGPREINVITWLSQVMPSVQQVVNQVNGAAPISRGKQNLVLECEAEAEIGLRHCASDCKTHQSRQKLDVTMIVCSSSRISHTKINRKIGI